MRKTSNYFEIITLFDPTNIVDLIAIGVETLKIDSGCSLDKEFTELICMNSRMILYQTINHVDSFHSCVCGPLT